jgi:uncharacterized repeat protein (TIGR01451 family)
VATATPAPVIAASGLQAGTVAGFEVDGDLKSGNAAGNPGNIPSGLYSGLEDAQDWLDGNTINGLVDPANPPESFIFRDAVDTSSVEGDASPDTSAYVGGNKEDDTRDWGYFNNAGPNDKTDYRHVMAGVKISGANPYVSLGAERIDTNGTMVVDFELNQKPFKVFSGAPGVAKPDRSINDLLISLEYANGGSNPEVTLYRVSAVQAFSTGQTVTFSKISDATTISAVRSATNFQALTGVAFPTATYDVQAFAWAEASVNLNALDLPVSCLTFGQGSIRSRTGGSPDSSQLKDASQPFPLSVNTCGRLEIEKRDAITNDLLPGATFKIEPDPTVGSSKTSITIVDGGSNDPDGKADGKVVFAACEPGEYTVTETAAPPGYFLPADVDQIKTILPGGSATFTFEDPLAKIHWQKEDASGKLLGGATFTITPNPRTGADSLTVVDNTGQAGYDGADYDETPGKFIVRRVKIGGPYVIAETTPPAGYIGTSATASVTIPANMAAPYVYTVTAGTFVNTLGSIRWVKNGPDGEALLGGATFKVTPDPRDGQGSLTVVDNTGQAGYTGADADATAGKFEIKNARTGDYSVEETAAPTGYILDSVPAQVTVSANTPNPQIATRTFINHLGKITWVKYGPDGTTLLGGATFEVTFPGGSVVTVVDCIGGPCLGPDKDGTGGEFELTQLTTGTYTIKETIAPAGYVLDGKVLTAEITSTLKSPYVVSAGSVKNTLGSISWVKNGPDGKALLGGATFTITPNPQTGTGTLVVVDDGANDADKTPGEFKVVDVLVDSKAPHYSIAETAAPAGYVGDASVVTVNPTTANPNVSVDAGTWINTLGSLAWEKRDGAGALLGGATFRVTGANGFDVTVLDNDDNDADKDNGQFKLTGLLLGGYTVNETIAPAGYVRDTAPRNATLTAIAPDAEITNDFVNPLGSLAWVKQDAAGNLLGGATFSVTGPNGYSVSVTDNLGLDADAAAGKFKLLDLKLGTYKVTETAAPAGYILDPAFGEGTLTQDAPNATIAKAFVNTLGELLWTKDKGDNAKTLLGGATFSVTPNPFTGSDSLTVADNDASDQDKADGKFRLINVRVGTYTVVETAAPEGYAKSTAQCSITVNAANPTGTPACSFSNPPIPPTISIVKTAGTSQATQVADGGTLEVEALALNTTYKYVVTNTGNVRLVDVTVTDDNGTPANTADDFQPTCYAGQAGVAQPFELAVGASVTCYATRSITVDTTNIAVAAGKSVGEGTPVKDDDDAKVVIVGPAINIVKTAGGSSASQVADGAVYETEAFASNVTYAYLVTNTGTTALQDVSLTDNKLGVISCPKAALAVDESMTCYATASVSVDTINLGVVKAESPSGTDVEDSDTAEVVILTPAIRVVKTAGNAADGTPLYTNGGNVVYTYVVTNIGEVALTNVTLDDNKLGAVTCPKTALAIGESMTCTKTGLVTVDTTNVATVEGSTPHATVDDTDDAVVLVRHASINKTNDAIGKQAPGATVGYEITVSVVNGPIPSLTVTDTLPDNFGTPSAISDGGVYNALANEITWTLANVADGKTLTYSVKIATTTQGGDYRNVAEITDGPCVTKCDDDSTVPVWRVSILKDNNASAPLLEGDDAVYTLTFDVQNGPIDSMKVTDTLPAEVVNPRSFSVAPVSVVGRVITWNLTNVADGATITYTATIADGTAAGSYTNVAEITEGPCVAGECDDDSTVVVVTPDLALTKVADEDPILAGDTAGFVITVTNSGKGAAKDVVLKDLVLPGGLQWSADKAACAITGASMTCQVGRLEPGATFTVHLTAPTTVAACGLLPNTATVAASNEPSDVLGNNTATDSITVQCASISLVKTAGTAADGTELLLAKPGNVIFTYVVANTGTADLKDVILVDDNATPANAADDITVTCPSTTLAAGATMTCTATLPVTFGLRTNIAVVTAVPVLEPQGEVTDTDDAVVRVPQPEVTPRPTPKLTPPPTSSLQTPQEPTSTGPGLLLVLLALAGTMLAVGYLIPAPARSRRRNDRG